VTSAAADEHDRPASERREIEQIEVAILGITVGPDHNLWFTENAGGPHIARITRAGVITTYKIPLPGSYNSTGIARGSGRTLWVTSNAVAGLVRVTIP
jgi:hypothetical protein